MTNLLKKIQNVMCHLKIRTSKLIQQIMEKNPLSTPQKMNRSIQVIMPPLRNQMSFDQSPILFGYFKNILPHTEKVMQMIYSYREQLEQNKSRSPFCRSCRKVFNELSPTLEKKKTMVHLIIILPPAARSFSTRATMCFP